MASSYCMKRFACCNNYLARRSISRWVAPTLQELYRRQEQAGPQPQQPRSSFVEWNYKAELFAFGHRLNEKFNENSLRIAFTHQSYIDQEEQKRVDLGMAKEEIPLNIQNNTEMAEKGEALMSNYILSYLRYCFPYFPEEGIVATHDYLTSVEVLAHVAKNIGISDLMLCSDFPPKEATLAQSFKAVVGALLEDDSEDRANLFVQDLVLTQLIDKDVHELWNVFNPMGVLSKILERQGRSPPESRLLREGGKKTILAVYVVGIYSDKEFLGMAPGETVDIAEEMAARDCLRRLFHLTFDQKPLPFGKEGRLLEIKNDLPNISIEEWTPEKAFKLLQTRAHPSNFEHQRKIVA